LRVKRDPLILAFRERFGRVKAGTGVPPCGFQRIAARHSDLIAATIPI
jgi:hypothetical protein